MLQWLHHWGVWLPWALSFAKDQVIFFVSYSPKLWNLYLNGWLVMVSCTSFNRVIPSSTVIWGDRGDWGIGWTSLWYLGHAELRSWGCVTASYFLAECLNLLKTIHHWLSQFLHLQVQPPLKSAKVSSPLVVKFLFHSLNLLFQFCQATTILCWNIHHLLMRNVDYMCCFLFKLWNLLLHFIQCERKKCVTWFIHC